ncbi:hypothetical protein LJB68_07895 [bacterium 210820-DFI.6.52]|nr:hypothetical protein [bacterium 210820-DFI.6.52]
MQRPLPLFIKRGEKEGLGRGSDRGKRGLRWGTGQGEGRFPFLPAARGRERGAPLKKSDGRDVLKFFHLFKKGVAIQTETDIITVRN